MSGAYYNEIDPYAAQWLRNLIAAGHIAAGDVDERSIAEVRPDDLRGYTQCHFFAGIGVWSYALRLAVWPDDQEVWTGSCPCQPFSAAGARKGFDDPRHLWPTWAGLIAQRHPSVVFGEQVASSDGYAWLDSVQADLEAMEYACGPVVLPAAGFGAPHGRHRIFFVADTEHAERRPELQEHAETHRRDGSGGCRKLGRLEYTHGASQDGKSPSGEQSLCDERGAGVVALEHTEGEQERVSRLARQRRATGGLWADADWIPCRGGKWRPIEPGSFPLAHGVAHRMDKLRAYGNAIVAPVAAEVIGAYMDIRRHSQREPNDQR